MCGRYFLSLDDPALLRIVEQARQRSQGVEIGLGELCPGAACAVVDARGARAMVWGFKGPDGKRLVINARSESVKDRPMFAGSFRNNRLVVPASSYYEWMKLQDGGKQKYELSREDEPLFMAGLWREEPGEDMPRFVVLTTDAAPSIREIHDRMPVLLRHSQLRDWLRGDAATAEQILRDVELGVRFGIV